MEEREKKDTWCCSVVCQGANLPDGYAQMPSAISYLCTGKAEEGEQTISHNFFQLLGREARLFSSSSQRHLRFVVIINHGRWLVQRRRFQTNDHLLLCRRSNAERSTPKNQQHGRCIFNFLQRFSNDSLRHTAKWCLFWWCMQHWQAPTCRPHLRWTRVWALAQLHTTVSR